MANNRHQDKRVTIENSVVVSIIIITISIPKMPVWWYFERGGFHIKPVFWTFLLMLIPWYSNNILTHQYTWERIRVTPLDLKGWCLVKLVFSLTNTNMEWIINKTEWGKNLVIHYENKFTKTINLLIFCIYLLNFSLEFFIMIFFVTNQLNISKFLPPRLRKTLISY